MGSLGEYKSVRRKRAQVAEKDPYEWERPTL